MNELERIIFAIESEIDTDLLERIDQLKSHPTGKDEALPSYKIPWYPNGNQIDYQSHAEFYKKKLTNIISILKGKTNV